MARYVGAFTRKDVEVLDYLVEESQASVSRVESVEIHPGDQGHLHGVGRGPCRAGRQQRPPKVDPPGQGFRSDPIAKVWRTRIEATRSGSRFNDSSLKSRVIVQGNAADNRGRIAGILRRGRLAERVLLPDVDLRLQRGSS